MVHSCNLFPREFSVLCVCVWCVRACVRACVRVPACVCVLRDSFLV